MPPARTPSLALGLYWHVDRRNGGWVKGWRVDTNAACLKITSYGNIVIRLSPYLLLSLINLPSPRLATFRSDATSTGSQAKSDDIHTAGKNMPLSHLILMLVRSREHTRL